MTQNNWTLTNFGRVDFYTEEFERLIHQRGARVVWEKSMFCSCLDPHTGQSDFTCPACHGKGYVYFNPTAIRAVVSGLGGNKEQLPIGLLDVGTAYLTTKASDRVGFRDRLTFTDFKTAYSQVLTYNGSPLKLRYEVEEIITVRVLSSEISGYTLGEDKQTLSFEPDTLTVGERFSILCHIKPVYVVIDIPHELRGSFIKFQNREEKWTELPKQFLIKREDLLPLQRGQLS